MPYYKAKCTCTDAAGVFHETIYCRQYHVHSHHAAQAFGNAAVHHMAVSHGLNDGQIHYGSFQAGLAHAPANATEI